MKWSTIIGLAAVSFAFRAWGISLAAGILGISLTYLQALGLTAIWTFMLASSTGVKVTK